MDVSEFIEGKYLKAAIVESSPNKKGVIQSEAKYVDSAYGVQLQCEVLFNGRVKLWNISQDAAKNLKSIFGLDSKAWIGREVLFSVLVVRGKQCLAVQPVIVPVETIGDDTRVHAVVR